MYSNFKQLNMIRLTCILMTAISFVGCSAYKTTTDFENVPESKLEKLVKDSQHNGLQINLAGKEKLSKPVKRVALVSFYVIDPGTKTIKTRQEFLYKETTITNRALTQDAASVVATGFYDASVKMMKKSFKDDGITLITPEDFSQNSQEWDQYKNVKVDYSLFGHFFKELSALTGNRLKKSAVAPGFRLFVVNQDPKFENTLGQLCRTLHVDAIALMGIKVTRGRAKVSIFHTDFELIGPDPRPGKDRYFTYDDFTTDFGSNRQSHSNIFDPILKHFGQKPVTFAELNKGEGKWDTYYKGFAVLASAIADKSVQFLNKGVIDLQ